MLSLSRILVPVDFSERCAGAVRCAIQLARRFQARITLLHVLPSIAAPPHEYPELYVGAIPADFADERRARAQRDLDQFMEPEIGDSGVQRTLVEGDAARQIAAAARDGGFDLIVMPTHGHGPFRRLLLGSVTAKVLHDAACPVWTSVHTEAVPREGPPPFKYVLCAFDLGPGSTTALHWAAQLSQRLEAQFGLVHALSLDPRTEAYYFSPEWRAQAFQSARSTIEATLETAGIQAEIQVESGDVRKAVCNAARRVHADLLVTGRGGAAGVTGRLASHTYSIIRDSPCPVVSV